MARSESQFLRDLKLLMGIGAAMAVLIAAVGYLALRDVPWQENQGLLREIALYVALGATLLVIVAAWIWRMIRKLKRQPPQADPP